MLASQTENISRTSTIQAGIFGGWVVSVSERKNTIASRDHFKQIRIGENVVVNYNNANCQEVREQFLNSGETAGY